jgi:ubiquinone/menaquinone biosynthesis C-methylase UbiE
MDYSAEQYDAGMQLPERFSLAQRRRRLLKNVTGRVLEIGAGTGANADKYMALANDPNGLLVATDVHFGRLTAIPHKNPNMPPACVDAQQLPFQDNSFDTVVGTLVFCSIPEPLRALAEIRRVIRPNGNLILLEHVRGNGFVSRRFTDWLQPAWGSLQSDCHLNRDTAQTVAEAGFTIINYDQSGWFGILAEINAVVR